MAELTRYGRKIALGILELIENNKVALRVAQVHYGDQELIPEVPAVCVEPAQTSKVWEGTSFMTLNTFQVAIILYHTGGEEGIRGTQKFADEVSDDIADFINLKSLPAMWGGDLLGGLITSGMVIAHEYGYQVRSDKRMRANRMVWEGQSKTRLITPAS